MNSLSRRIAFFAPAAVMAAWATVMLHTIASGHINRLLSPMFRAYALVAAIALLLLSILYILLYQPTGQAAPATALAPAGRLRQFGRWLVLLVPLVAAAILSPDALSSTTLNNRALLDSTAGVAPMPSWNAASEESAKKALDSDPNQPVPVEVTDLLTLGEHPEQMKAFEGRPIHVVGLMDTSSTNAPKLVRWVMWCCAADAVPKTVELTGKIDTNHKDTEWLDVTGKAHFPTVQGKVTPQIEVDSIAPAQEPDEPYLSP